MLFLLRIKHSSISIFLSFIRFKLLTNRHKFFMVLLSYIFPSPPFSTLIKFSNLYLAMTLEGAKGGGLKIEYNVLRYGELAKSSKPVGSERNFCAGMTYFDEFQCYVHDADLNAGPSANVSVLRAVITQKHII